MKNKVFICLSLISALLNVQLVFAQTNRSKAKPAVQTNASTLKKTPNALNFLVMGDWGRNGEDHQQLVANQMGKTAAEIEAEFVISTGDNFYPSGVISEFDPLWRYSYEDIYKAFSLQCEWYPVLGNHDYKANPDAQVAYTKVSRRWKMPARYYSKTFNIHGDTTQKVLVAFIDTSPLIKEFYANSTYSGAVQGQDTTAQKRWLENLLSNPSPNIKWKIVVGHHPLYSGGKRRTAYDTKAIYNSLKNLLDKYEVDAYLAGHEHDIQHIVPKGKTQHFISGAASEVRPTGMLPESKFAAAQYGFMAFSITSKELFVQTVDYTGKIIYKTTISK